MKCPKKKKKRSFESLNMSAEPPKGKQHLGACVRVRRNLHFSMLPASSNENLMVELCILEMKDIQIVRTDANLLQNVPIRQPTCANTLIVRTIFISLYVQ